MIKSIFKNERVWRDIYQNRKSTGTRWLWQQIGIYIKTEKAQKQDGFGNKIKYHFHITTVHKYHFFVFCLYLSCLCLCRVMWKWYFILLPKPSCFCAFSVLTLMYIPICCQSHLVPVLFRF